MPQTREKRRLQITKLNVQNFSVSHVWKITNLYKSTVSRTIIRYNDQGDDNNNKKTGRQKKVNQRMEKIVIQASNVTLSQTLPK